MNQKEIFKKHFADKIEENFSSIEKYFDHHLHELCALNSIKHEVIDCLALGLYQSSITATNHLLERTLKLSLIELETKDVNYSDIEKYTKVVNHAFQQYDHLYLHQTLKNNRNKGLISQEEFDYLSNVSKTIRDAYSHAQTSVINREMPDKFTGFLFSISEVKNNLIKGEKTEPGKRIDIPTSSPTISQIFQENISKEKALEYFANVYTVIMNIEMRLKEKKTAHNSSFAQ